MTATTDPDLAIDSARHLAPSSTSEHAQSATGADVTSASGHRLPGTGPLYITVGETRGFLTVPPQENTP